MSSQARNERGDAKRLDLRTLVIASVASAVAAIVVSRIWASGTPIAAAATPVLITLIRELLDHPTSKIAERFTADTRALPETEVREPVAAGDRSTSRAEEGAGEIRVYRQQPTGRVTGRIKPKVVLVTGLLAFAIAALVITGGQVLAGHHFGSGGNGAIILGQHETKQKSSSTTDEPSGTTPDREQTSPRDQGQTTPQDQQPPATTTPSDQKQAPAQTTPESAPRNAPTAPPASP